MPKLGLGSKSTNSGLITPGIVTDNLVLKHKYDSGSVVPVSDGAAFFDGSDDYIECGTIGLNPNSVTVSTWVKFPGEDSSDSYARIFEADGDEKSYHLRYDKANNRFVVRLSSNGSDHTLCTGTGVVTSFTPWYHFAFTYNASGGAIKLYVNGDLDATATHSGGGNLHVPSTPRVRIGQESNANSNNWDGYICNAGVWSSALTQPQIKSIMNKNYAGLTDSEKTNLVSWWNLDETIETTNISDEPNIVLDNNASNTEVLNWKSNFSGTGITENSNAGNFEVNANPPYTESYIDNDNKTVRLRALLDGPDDGTSVDHIQVKTSSSLTVGKSYKIVVTVDSISGRFRVRPGTASAAADMTTTGVHTFYFHKSPSTYWRLERDLDVGDITVSDIKIYEIGNIGELS